MSGLVATAAAPNYGQLFGAAPVALLVLRASDLVMVDANQAYLAAVGMPRESIVDHHVFDVFPNSPVATAAGDDHAGGLAALYRQAIDTATTQVVEAMVYDIPNPDGGFDRRFWDVVEVPVTAGRPARPRHDLDEVGDGDEVDDADNRVQYVLHYAIDATERVLAQQQLLAAQAAADAAAIRVAALADVAVAVAGAERLTELEILVGSAVSRCSARTAAP